MKSHVTILITIFTLSMAVPTRSETCTVPFDFTGSRDVIFIFDDLVSEDFLRGKSVSKMVIKQNMTLGPDNVRIAVMVTGKEPKVLLDYISSESRIPVAACELFAPRGPWETAVMATSTDRPSSNLDGAFSTARHMFNSSRSQNAGALGNLILVSRPENFFKAGMSQEDRDWLIQHNVSIYGMGVGLLNNSISRTNTLLTNRCHYADAEKWANSSELIIGEPKDGLGEWVQVTDLNLCQEACDASHRCSCRQFGQSPPTCRLHDHGILTPTIRLLIYILVPVGFIIIIIIIIICCCCYCCKSRTSDGNTIRGPNMNCRNFNTNTMPHPGLSNKLSTPGPQNTQPTLDQTRIYTNPDPDTVYSQIDPALEQDGNARWNTAVPVPNEEERRGSVQHVNLSSLSNQQGDSIYENREIPTTTKKTEPKKKSKDYVNVSKVVQGSNPAGIVRKEGKGHEMQKAAYVKSRDKSKNRDTSEEYENVEELKRLDWIARQSIDPSNKRRAKPKVTKGSGYINVKPPPIIPEFSANEADQEIYDNVRDEEAVTCSTPNLSSGQTASLAKDKIKLGTNRFKNIKSMFDKGEVPIMGPKSPTGK